MAAPGGGAAVAPGEVPFRYEGPTSATVIGPVTGRRYRFGAPGAVVGIDPRDVPAVRLVPVVRAV